MSKIPSILDWMDDILKEYVEYEEIAAAIDPEFVKLHEYIDQWNKNVYPKEANEEGIAKFEELLNITPAHRDTLEERRYRVIAKLNAKLPYSEIQLRRILGGILGYDGFTLTVEDLILTISLAEANNTKLDILVELLREIVPMNILLVIHQLITSRVTAYSCTVMGMGLQITILPVIEHDLDPEGETYTASGIVIGNKINIKPIKK